MTDREKPYFVIKKDLQKTSQTGVSFRDVISAEVLRDVCRKITGRDDFDCDFVGNDYEDEFLEKSYNKGRLAILQYHDEVSYISFSEKEIGGRNSSVQSVPTAFNMYYLNPYPEEKKRLYYYFLNTTPAAETDYQVLIYRLMRTIGFEFLNARNSLLLQINPFVSVDDIILNRVRNADRNHSNNSTFITKNDPTDIEIYGKTYGANKYETSLICYAVSRLLQVGQQITLNEVLEGNLKVLPKSSLKVIAQMGNIKVVPTDMTQEKKLFEKYDSLRSPRYLLNLYNRLGNKKCILCNCQIPELVQGAHVWPVSEIKKNLTMSRDKMLECAIDGNNGLWLCENHHKLFDENFLSFNDNNGKIRYKDGINRKSREYIDEITIIDELPEFVMNERFCEYLQKRNEVFN